MKYLELTIGAILVYNFVLSRFLGICPFLGVSKRLGTALGMSGAVIFVMTIASFITSLVYRHLLHFTIGGKEYDLSFLQVLLFNPIPLFYVVRVTKSTLKKRHEAFWKYAAAVIVLFLVGGFFQRYAEGVYVLALSLLIRCVWNIVYQNKYLSDKRND